MQADFLSKKKTNCAKASSKVFKTKFFSVRTTFLQHVAKHFLFNCKIFPKLMLKLCSIADSNYKHLFATNTQKVFKTTEKFLL